MAYKIKTTYQTRYAVKPNQGVVDSRSNVKVNIMIILNDVNDITSIKDKFQITYLPVEDTFSEENLNDLWKNNRGKESSKT